MKDLSKYFVKHSESNIPIGWWLREKHHGKCANHYIGAFGDLFHPMSCYWETGVVLGFEI